MRRRICDPIDAAGYAVATAAAGAAAWWLRELWRRLYRPV